ncbi:zinc ribbon domain-containing protein [Rhodoferax ferrireducens]|uniref:zinc ribbon domain-containing protein n=1 Tax=Rhodoferax ferrireducens TaxID=192843 RepID=UPI000E0D9C59|nr:zinc ribbon domain-containing protein [Rhodoferax ferrireducens]
MSTPYTRCPKCGHQPLPAVQALPTACPQCGVILAKVGQVARRASPAPDADTDGHSDEPGWTALLTHVPERVDAMHFWARAALLAGLAFWGRQLIGMDYRTGEMGASFLHRPILVFHEAGHVIFIPLGQWMMVLGGTLGQLIMPAILAGALLMKNRDPFGAAVGLWFLGVSVLDVAPYMYDALHPQLMLLSGTTGEEGGHDWIYLFSSLGLLSKAQLIGDLTHKLGALVVLLALGWAAWLLRRQYSRVVRPVVEER